MFPNTHNLPLTNSNPPMPTVNVSKGRDCTTCNKENECKYKESVTEEVTKLLSNIEKLNLPLFLNINCQEWNGKITGIESFVLLGG